MPNHWHLLVRPGSDDALARFMHRLTMTHTRRWPEHRGALGEGHLYQGRFESFPVRDDRHFLLAVARYVERNPLRAGLVARAERWPWSSLGRGSARRLPLAGRPVAVPVDWAGFVKDPQTDTDLAAVRASVDKGRPFGGADRQAATAARLGLESSGRPTGRPREERA